MDHKQDRTRTEQNLQDPKDRTGHARTITTENLFTRNYPMPVPPCQETQQPVKQLQDPQIPPKMKQSPYQPPRRSLRQPMPKSNDYKSCLKPKIPLYLTISHYWMPKDLLRPFRPYPSALVDPLRPK